MKTRCEKSSSAAWREQSAKIRLHCQLYCRQPLNYASPNPGRAPSPIIQSNAARSACLSSLYFWPQIFQFQHLPNSCALTANTHPLFSTRSKLSLTLFSHSTSSPSSTSKLFTPKQGGVPASPPTRPKSPACKLIEHAPATPPTTHSTRST